MCRCTVDFQLSNTTLLADNHHSIWSMWAGVLPNAVSTSHIWTSIQPAWCWTVVRYQPSPGRWTLIRACMPRPTMSFWSPVGCTPAPGAMTFQPNSPQAVACYCPGSWCPMTVKVWPTYTPDAWALCKASFCRQLPHPWSMPGLIT